MNIFDGINTLLIDINGRQIFCGKLVVRGKSKPLNGAKPKNKIPPMGYKPYKVVYHDGAFKLQRSANKKKIPLNSLMIRFYGIEIYPKVRLLNH